MTERKVTIPTEEEILKSVKDNFPQIDLKNYVINTDGWDHVVLLVDNKHVFRFPLDQDYLKQLGNEIKILKQIAPFLSAQIPVYKYIPKILTFAGYDMLPGKQLTKTVFAKLTAAERTEIAKQIATFMTELHGTIANDHSFPDLPAWLILEDQEELKVSIKNYLPSKLTPAELDRVHQIVEDIDQLIKLPLPQVFTHNDLYSSHILWDETKQKIGVIDFSDMCLGDPAVDFNELYEYGKDFVEEIYSYYQGPKDETFLERAEKYQQWTGVFMMTDHFINNKTTWAEAREIFDRT